MLNGIQLDALLYRIAALLLAIAVHDAVQAAAALMLGDRTAKEERRLTLNPVAHLSAIGLLPVLFGPFGWSKPIPVDRDRLQGRTALRATLIYACGPIANLALGIVLWWVAFQLPAAVDGWMPAWLYELIRGILEWSYIMNMMFVLLHLLPFYPMDMWLIVRGWLPAAWAPALNKREKLGIAVLFGLAVTPIGQLLFQNGFEWLSGLIMDLYAWG
ncbi:site-2 protease family protein [Paenibacillus sp. HJGM_3]|uniref:site-2 protease family protein n=1 Tax=Paenibacillus sp. HJGM_3 TaxID=3379816 RepID=UPI00385DA7D1